VNTRIERNEPPYKQLVTHYRAAISSGTLADGERLPTVREIAESWGVAFTTAAKAIRALSDEGLVMTSNQGTVVRGPGSRSTPDRLLTLLATSRIYPAGERAVILAADLVPAPDHVATAMLLSPGDPVVRRERINLIDPDTTPTQRSVSWLPGDLAEQVPALLVCERIVTGTVGAVATATGRVVQRATYRAAATRATAQDAEHLALTEGDPVIRQESTWWEGDDAVLEWGETTYPEGRWIEWETTTVPAPPVPPVQRG
jgi:GntR family transcriptional regulator